jgi:hypothetical protein
VPTIDVEHYGCYGVLPEPHKIRMTLVILLGERGYHRCD